jgi:hypothetical protein
MKPSVSLLLVFAASSCQRAEKQQPPALSAQTPSAASPAAPAPSALAPPKASLPPFTLGPKTDAASPAERKQAVLDLLAGGDALLSLPQHDLEPGHDFEPNLRDRLAPKVSVGPEKVRFGTPTIQGKLPPEVVVRVVRQRAGQLRSCYALNLRRDPALKGDLTAAFVVGAQGQPTSFGFAPGSIDDKPLRACVQSAFKQITFPEPEGGPVSVSYPITFSTD